MYTNKNVKLILHKMPSMVLYNQYCVNYTIIKICFPFFIIKNVHINFNCVII